MKFSVVVPVYKVEQYLDRCVDSLINQTERDIEIILVDDGSPDNCHLMCDEWAKKDERIKVVHKANGGLSDARNAGLAVAEGEYVLFVDSDDYIEKSAIERFCSYIGEGADILVGDTDVIGGKNYFSHSKSLLSLKVSGEKYLEISLAENLAPAPVWLNAYRREFLIDNDLKFKVGILHEDEQFMPRVFLGANSVIYTGINFYRYVIREDSITTKKDKRRNSRDIYSTCVELEEIYQGVKNHRLKRLLCDRLATLWLTVFYFNDLIKHGKEFYNKAFVLRNSKKLKTRILAAIFLISPRLFCYIYRKFSRK